ncbi:MAG: THUMP domain-containing protein [Candidatus Nanoarchaeia archaeon]
MKNEPAINMGTNVVVLREGELFLKGKNRREFENKLVENLKTALRNTGVAFKDITLLRGRVLVYFWAEDELKKALNIIRCIFGVQSFSKGVITEKNIKKAKNELSEFFCDQFKSFRVTATRQDKKFGLTSPQIEKELGQFICEETGAKVDLKNHDREFLVEICEKGIVVSAEKEMGAGGLPLGVGGKVAVLSGHEAASDAAICLMRRGCRVVFFGNSPKNETLRKYNNFSYVPCVLDWKSDILGTMRKHKAKALAVGCGPKMAVKAKMKFSGCLVLAPLVGAGE